MEKDLGEARLLVGQYEAKMKSLNESIKDLDGKKRSLEEQVDTLNEDVSKLKAAEQMHQVASEERQEEMQMRTALEQQISQVTTTTKPFLTRRTMQGLLKIWTGHSN